MARANFEVIVSGVRELTPRVREYRLRSADGSPLPAYTAGAHVALHTVSPQLGLVVRHYSLIGGTADADDPADTWRIAVQREDRGRGSAHIHASFREGTTLHVGPPVNNFPLDRRDRQVLLIAGGIGVTPIFSMARSLARRRREFQIVYAGRHPDAMPYLEELTRLCGDRLRCHFSETQGRADPADWLREQPEGAVVYACGPQGLVAATQAAAVRLGWHADRVRTETFDAGCPADAAPFDVRLQRSGRTIHIGADVSILDALLAEGLPLLWDCRRGECGLCPLPVVSSDGEIVHRDRYLSDEEKKRNDSLCICVSRTRGRELVLDI